MALFEIRNLSFAYSGSGEILKNINIDIDSGDFAVLCGPTGCGKTTLLRLLKPELSPLGKTEGDIFFKGRSLSCTEPSASASIGFIQQSVDHQIVTDKVWHEIAFGMENLGLDDGLMKRRMAEAMGFFGIESLADKKISDLSGGQKQLVSLAAVTAMNPEVIILDEPTSQLDPVTASEFLITLKKLNDETGITVIITEHRLENVIPMCNKLIVMDKGTIAAYGNVKETIEKIKDNGNIFSAMPGAVRMFYALKGEGNCPLSVREGRNYLMSSGIKLRSLEDKKDSGNKECAVNIHNIFFRYSRDGEDVLKNLSLRAYKSEILCILGANGSGKSTLLRTLSGLQLPYAGKIEILGRNIKKYTGQSLYRNCVALLPQNSETVFLRNTLKEEIADSGITFGDLPFDLSYAADMHPYDLSGGEQQLAALGKVLALNPEILLLDEPTKGLDRQSKDTIRKVLTELKEKGLTVIMVTHDVEFAAECADRCAMLFRGEIASYGRPREFFSGNTFYTTSISRITASSAKGIITADDLVTSREVPV